MREAGQRYRAFEEWEREELIANLATIGAAPEPIQRRMIEYAAKSSGVAGMQTAFDRGYTRLASLADLADGTARVFRAGGATLLLIRDGAEVLAFDGSCVAQDRSLPGRELVGAIIECLNPATTPATALDIPRLRGETANFRDWPRFPTTIETDGIWVHVNEPTAR